MFKKYISCFALISVLSINSLIPAYAADNSKTEEASKRITDAINLILDNYSGKIDTDTLVEGALSGMFDKLDDYSAYLNKNDLEKFNNEMGDSPKGLGFSAVRLLDGTLFVTGIHPQSPAARVQMHSFDIITKINGYKLKEMYTTNIEDIADFYGTKPIKITVWREDDKKEYDFTLTPKQFSSNTVSVSMWSDVILLYDNSDAALSLSRTNYVRISLIAKGTAKEFEAAMEFMKTRKTETMILDLRGNPGGYVDEAIEICKMIVPSGLIITTVDKNGKKEKYESTLSKPPFKKIYLLVDGNTASSAEIIASALKDSKAALVIGEKTYGKGVGQAVFEMENGGGAKITIVEFFSRNGTKVNGVGIRPDIETANYSQYIYPTYPELGNTHERMTYIRKLLNALDYGPLIINDKYDENVVSAIKSYQIDKGISDTGIIDMETAIKLHIDGLEYTARKNAAYARAIKDIRENSQ